MEKELLDTVIQSWDAYKRFFDEYVKVPVDEQGIEDFARKIDNQQNVDAALMKLIDSYED